jgi:type I restriction enzyme S subunit
MITWPTKKLGEICEEIKKEKAPMGIIPYIEIGNIDVNSKKVIFNEKGAVKGSIFAPENSILISRVRPTRGAVTFIDKKIAVSSAFTIIKPRPEYNPKLLFYFLAWNKKFFEYLGERQKGTNYPSVREKDILEFEISFPENEGEQQKIVKILDTIQSAVEIQEKIIEKTKELKKSLMAELFKYGAPSFRKGRKLKKTEIGEIPEDWEVVRLGEYFEFKNGINFKKEQKGKGTLVLDVLNMYTESLYPNLNEIYRVEGSFSEEYYLKQGDILFVRSSLKQEGVGWCAVFSGYSEPVLFCGFLIRARPKTEKTNSNFFVYLFRTENFRNQIISQSGMVTITNLSQSILSNLLIPLPPLPEQQEIAKILQTIDQKIEIEKKKKELYEELFKTMLNHLMMGKIKVENIEI